MFNVSVDPLGWNVAIAPLGSRSISNCGMTGGVACVSPPISGKSRRIFWAWTTAPARAAAELSVCAFCPNACPGTIASKAVTAKPANAEICRVLGSIFRCRVDISSSHASNEHVAGSVGSKTIVSCEGVHTGDRNNAFSAWSVEPSRPRCCQAANVLPTRTPDETHGSAEALAAMRGCARASTGCESGMDGRSTLRRRGAR